MDRSFLSDAQMIEASRDFVCIRLATYEDSEEAVFLRELYGAELANTVFAILTPDAKTTLSRAGRRPSFRSAGALASYMNQTIEKDYSQATSQRWTDPQVPEIKSLDLALNVATCDYIPLLLALGKDEQELASLRKEILPLAWNAELAGQFIFASAKISDDLRSVPGLSGSPSGFYVIQPGSYGLSGKILHEVASIRQEKSKLLEIVSVYKPTPKNHSTHTKFGVQMGFKWNTEIPVTDKQFVKATERIWGEKYIHQAPKDKTSDDAEKPKQP